MITLAPWLHELASLVTVMAAAVWLVWRWLRIGRPRAELVVGCARCDRNPGLTVASTPDGAVRSPRLRVLR